MSKISNQKSADPSLAEHQQQQSGKSIFLGSNNKLWGTKFPELFVITIAILTRFWRLNYHSIWFDEAVSLFWAKADFSYMLRTTFLLVEEKHPPVYYSYLKLWHGALEQFGLQQSDAWLRASGALLGLLTVVGIMLLAHRASGRATALLTGLLVALSPVLVWYSQELRMFQPATTGIVWAAYFMHRAWYNESFRQRWIHWLGALICLVLALYTYLYVPFILPVAGLTFLGLALLQKRWQPFFEGGIMLALAGIIFAPLAYNAWSVSVSQGTPAEPFANFVGNMTKLFKIFTIWKENWSQPFVSGALIFLAILLLVGLIGSRSNGRKVGDTVAALSDGRPLDRWWLCAWIGGMILVSNMLLARSGSIFREDRYLIFMAPFVLWGIARGSIVLWDLSTRFTQSKRLWQALGAGSAIGAVLLLAIALPRSWSPEMFRENWRAAATYIDNYQASSPHLPSAGVAHINYTHQPLEWYLRANYTFDELPVFGLFGNPITPERIEPDVAPPLLGIRKELGSATLWLTQSHLEGVDDDRLVEQWLAQQYPLITEQYPSGVKLTGYALQTIFETLPQLSASATYPNIEVAPGLTVAACEITTPALSATDAEMHPPSGWVHVRIWWQATGPIADDYLSRAQMVGPEGIWGERLQRDWLAPESDPLKRFPSSGWSVGQIVREEVDVNLNPETPSNSYPIVVGVQNRAGDVSGPMVECGRVTIQ